MSELALQSFGFEDHLVRVLDQGGAPWFIAQDICSCLEIGNHRQAVAGLDDDEKDGVTTNDSIGRQQVQTIISESGLYALIFKSRKAAAVRFRKWVTSEVLPTLRRTGEYKMVANDDVKAPRLNGTPQQVESYKLALSTVRAAKEVFGEQVAQKMWPQLGLPDVPEIQRLNDRRSGQMPDGPLHEWTGTINMRHSPTRTTPTGFLYDCYAHWCDKNHYRPFSEQQFIAGLGHIFGEPNRFGFHVEHD